MRREEENRCLICGRSLDHGSSSCITCQAARNAPIESFDESMRAAALKYIAWAARKAGKLEDWIWIEAEFRRAKLKKKDEIIEQTEFANSLLFECGLFTPIAKSQPISWAIEQQKKIGPIILPRHHGRTHYEQIRKIKCNDPKQSTDW